MGDGEAQGSLFRQAGGIEVIRWVGIVVVVVGGVGVGVDGPVFGMVAVFVAVIRHAVMCEGGRVSNVAVDGGRRASLGASVGERTADADGAHGVQAIGVPDDGELGVLGEEGAVLSGM